MTIEIKEQDLTNVLDYRKIPIAFEVGSVLEVTENRQIPGKFILTERTLNLRYVKNYDAIEGERPVDWARRFDVSSWRMFTAQIDDRQVGGAVIAVNTPDFMMMAGRGDLALIWDLRVSPETRGRGVGRALFRAAENWARDQGCCYLRVETQHLNVAACRFYEAQGFELIEANREAYRESPDEVQLIWQKVIY